MPDVTISAPVGVDPVDRLTLGASDARNAEDASAQGSFNNGCFCCAGYGYCMAED